MRRSAGRTCHLLCQAESKILSSLFWQSLQRPCPGTTGGLAGSVPCVATGRSTLSATTEMASSASSGATTKHLKPGKRKGQRTFVQFERNPREGFCECWLEVLLSIYIPERFSVCSAVRQSGVRRTVGPSTYIPSQTPWGEEPTLGCGLVQKTRIFR